MKTIKELKLGFSDAQNYSQRKNKKFFNDIFVKNTFLDSLLDDNIYFLIGEKGTGKTAYATYLSNNSYKNTRGLTTFINATDYEKFYTLKQQKGLCLSDYSSIWKVIILLLLSQFILENEKSIYPLNKSKLKAIQKAINEYYSKAFSPEVSQIMNIVDESEIFAKLLCKYSEASGKQSQTIEFSETKIQHNLYYIEKMFSNALSSIKLKDDIVLFIDGIDIRPEKIKYEEYIECIKGLADAVWFLNTSTFANIKGSDGLFRVVLLLRPDIYYSLSLQNAAAKLKDNAVYLDWTTTYENSENSILYDVANKILSNDQEFDPNIEDYFKVYFPWKKDDRTAFMEFLKISLSRPRDILMIMQIIQENMNRNNSSSMCSFKKEVYESNNFQNSYSEYFLSSLKDQLSFYYSNNEFDLLVEFFKKFDESTFSYQDFCTKFDEFGEYILNNENDIPEFMTNQNKLLQILYDSNIIGAIENAESNTVFYHFSYREREIYNIYPKVPIGENFIYCFHYGMYKKVKLGRY